MIYQVLVERIQVLGGNPILSTISAADFVNYVLVQKPSSNLEPQHISDKA
jgi:hypothetical protein